MQRIVEAVRENDSIVTLTFGFEDETPISQWSPGQFLRLSVLKDSAWTEEHTFTISSAPEDGVVQVTVKAVGPFTTSLQTIEPGTEVKLRGPYGRFCKGIDELSEITMIAGGIGITPFLSVLRHFRHAGAGNKVLLFWANNRLSDVIRREELEKLFNALDLRVVHALWKEDAAHLGHGSFQNEFYHRGLLSPDLLTGYCDIHTCPLFLCGPPKMNEHLSGVLQQVGIDMSTVHKETLAPPKPAGSGTSK